MNIIGGFVDHFVQCWGCSIFDRLFQIVSAAGVAVYQAMVTWAWIVLAAFWGFYIFWVVYKTLTDKDVKDYLYQDTIKPVLINSLFVCVLLGMGVQFPKFITTITFEPAADMIALYTESVLQTDAETVDEKVTYVPEPMRDDGFFTPALRDKVIHLMKTSITQFQSMIKLGLAVMDNAFSLSALLGIGNLLSHILMFIMGAYLVFTFFMLFVRFCFYFVDVIVALAMFAFFFPFMLVFFVFKNSKAAKWVQDMGSAFSPSLLKNVINAIAGLAVAVIVYSIAMVVIAKFFAMDAVSSNEIIRHILDGTITEDHLANNDLANMTLLGCIVVGFLINYLTAQIRPIGASIFAAFGVNPETKMSEELGAKVETVVKNMVEGAAKKIEVLATEKKEEKAEDKTGEKKEETK